MKKGSSVENPTYNAQQQFSMYANVGPGSKEGYLNTPRTLQHNVPPQLPPPVLFHNNGVETVITPVHTRSTIYTHSLPIVNPETISPFHAYTNSYYTSPTRSVLAARSSSSSSNVYSSPSSSQPVLPNRASVAQTESTGSIGIGHNLISKGSLKLGTRNLQLPKIPNSTSQSVVHALEDELMSIDMTDQDNLKEMVVSEVAVVVNESTTTSNIEHVDMNSHLEPVDSTYIESTETIAQDSISERSQSSMLSQNVSFSHVQNEIMQLKQQLLEKEDIISHKNTALSAKDEIIAHKDLVIQQKDQIISEKNAILRQKEAIFHETKSILEEKDLLLAQKDQDQLNSSILNESMTQSSHKIALLELDNQKLLTKNTQLDHNIQVQREQSEQKHHQELTQLKLDLQQQKKVTHLQENDKLVLEREKDGLQEQLRVVQNSLNVLSAQHNPEIDIDELKSTISIYQQQNHAQTKRLQQYSAEVEALSAKVTQKDVDIHKIRASWETERSTERREWGIREEALTQRLEAFAQRGKQHEQDKKEELRAALDALDIGDGMMRSLTQRLETAEDQKKVLRAEVERLENRVKWLSTQRLASEYVLQNRAELDKVQEPTPKFIESDKWAQYSELIQKLRK